MRACNEQTSPAGPPTTAPHPKPPRTDPASSPATAPPCRSENTYATWAKQEADGKTECKCKEYVRCIASLHRWARRLRAVAAWGRAGGLAGGGKHPPSHAHTHTHTHTSPRLAACPRAWAWSR